MIEIKLRLRIGDAGTSSKFNIKINRINIAVSTHENDTKVYPKSSPVVLKHFPADTLMDQARIAIHIT